MEFSSHGNTQLRRGKGIAVLIASNSFGSFERIDPEAVEDDKRFSSREAWSVVREIVEVGYKEYGVISKWLAKHPRFVLHFIPTSSGWLNLVERWFE